MCISGDVAAAVVILQSVYMSITNGDISNGCVNSTATAAASGGSSSSIVPTKSLLNLQSSALEAFASARNAEECMLCLAEEQRENRLATNAIMVSRYVVFFTF